VSDLTVERVKLKLGKFVRYLWLNNKIRHRTDQIIRDKSLEAVKDRNLWEVPQSYPDALDPLKGHSKKAGKLKGNVRLQFEAYYDD